MSAPCLRLIVDIELEGLIALSVEWQNADTYPVRKRLWWWMLSRRGFAQGLEELLSGVDVLERAA